MKALFTGRSALRGCAILAALASSLCFAAVALGLPPFTTAPKTSTGSGGQAELFDAAVGLPLRPSTASSSAGGSRRPATTCAT